MPVLTGLALAGFAVPAAQAETVRDRQWYLDAMRAEQMWKTSTGMGVTVAVLDTGVDPELPDLRGQVLPGKDFSTLAGDEHTDYNGHGTGMAVFIAGTGKKGAASGSYGLAPGAKILPVRVPDYMERNREDGNQDNYATAIAKAIHYAADTDAKVINVSLAKAETSSQLDDAVAYALSKNKLIFAGVGNSGDAANDVEYPAATPGVVGVGAIGQDLKRTAESQHGPQVDVVAPGDEMIRTCNGKTGLCKSHGTSDATALASASAALIWSKHPNWTNNQVLRVMLNTASGPVSGKKRTDEIGYGAIRPRIALSDPGEPGPADQYPLPDFSYGGSTASEGSAAKPPKNDPSPAVAAGDEGMNPLPWILGGVGAVALVGGGLVVAALRSRRRQNTTASAAAPGWQPSAQQPYVGGRPQSGPGPTGSPAPGGQQWPYQQENNHTGRP
ncbi:type VII secretion-associated serine protease mycosin [Streptomyces sp. VRA16 Mangrove soil]|uniref:type VII secretion-associated serine protease mycosin n=1 Tax=Streptomyces sp. VRA16 Mangrove soil TaxID=2817434 RepID=UPI0027DD1D7C|nr:type VII secretion-associated serine protease mycosin [Streptomyces sp. VRA16 Mangrove soil]